MRTAILVCASFLASCVAINSYSTAARQLSEKAEIDDRYYYCWSRTEFYQVPCLPSELHEDLWHCVHKLAAVGNAMQSLAASRGELITCMRQVGWYANRVDIGRDY